MATFSEMTVRKLPAITIFGVNKEKKTVFTFKVFKNEGN